MLEGAFCLFFSSIFWFLKMRLLQADAGEMQVGWAAF